MSETIDPLDTPLPCDVRIGHILFRQGVSLRILVDNAERWHAMASASLTGTFPAKDATHE